MTIPSGYGQISVVHIGGGIVGEAIWTLGFDNNASQAPAETAEQIWNTLNTGDYQDVISSSVTITEVRVKNGPDATGPSGVFTVGLDGNVGGQAAPPNIAALVHKNTLLGGRQGRGRLYVGGLAEASLDANGLITSGTQASLQAVFDLLGEAMVLLSIPPHLLHADDLSPTMIDSFQVDQLSATQRRRLRR